MLATRTVECVRVLLSLQVQSGELVPDFSTRLQSVAAGAKLHSLQLSESTLVAVVLLGLSSDCSDTKRGVLSADSAGSATFPEKLLGAEKLAAEWVASVPSKSTAGSVMVSAQASAAELVKQEQKRRAAERLAEEESQKLKESATVLQSRVPTPAAMSKSQKSSCGQTTPQSLKKSKSPTDLPPGSPKKKCDCGELHFYWECPKKSEDERNTLTVKCKESRAKLQEKQKEGSAHLLHSSDSSCGFTTHAHTRLGEKLRDLRESLPASERHELECGLWHQLTDKGKAGVSPSPKVQAALSEVESDDRLVLLQPHTSDLVQRKQTLKLSREHPPDLVFYGTLVQTLKLQVTHLLCQVLPVLHLYESVVSVVTPSLRKLQTAQLLVNSTLTLSFLELLYLTPVKSMEVVKFPVTQVKVLFV